MKHLLIGTTAINRSILHSDIIPEWSNFICKLDFNVWKVQWFINIDCIKNLTDTYEETKDNLLNIIDNRIDVNILPSKPPHFLTACKLLTKNIKDYVDTNNLNQNEVVIFWLEDDWKLNINYPQNVNIGYLIDNFLHNNHYLTLTYIRNNYIWALAPSFVSYDLWLDLFYNGWVNETRDIDPEHCMGQYYRKKYGNPENLKNLTLINKKIDESFMNQGFMNFENSNYSYLNQTYEVLPHKNNYIPLDDLKQNKVNNQPVMIRMTPNMTIGGCQYARKFMDEHAGL